MNIREATKEDIPSILPAWRELMTFHAEREPFYKTCESAEDAFANYVRENIEKDDACVFVAEVDGAIVGYCQCLIIATPPVLEIKQYGNIADIAVLQTYRRRGIGEQMVRRAIEWFQLRGLCRAEVRAAISNEISIPFWRKMGFTTYLETMSQSIDVPGRA